MKARIAIVCLLSGAAWAQQNQPEVVTHEAPATFSSRVNLVSVPVVIRDRDGRSVGSLKQEDFQLFDKAKLQVITKFTIETTASIAESGSRPAGASETSPPPGAPKPELPSRYVAYFFDDVHMKAGDLLQARQAALQQLEQPLDSRGRAGIFTTSGRTTQDFTNDMAKLRATLNRIQPWAPAINPETDCPSMTYYVADVLVNQNRTLSPVSTDAQILSNLNSDQLLNAVFAEAQNCVCKLTDPNCPPLLIAKVKQAAQLALAYGMNEAITSLYTLQDLIKSMSVLPGSRTIVMASPGFVMTAEHRVNENDIFDKAIRAGVTINTLDIRGLYTGGIDASDRGHSSAVLAQADRAEASLGSDLLAEFAAATGGTFFHNDNGIADGLQQLASRPEYVYVLGFSPDNLKFDGSYHKLKVTLKNGMSLTVEARRGYWAPNHAIDPAEEAREEVQDAVFSQDERMDIPVKLHTEFFKQSEAKAELTVETRVDLKNVKFRKADDRNRDTLIVVTGLFDQNGRYVKGTERTMDMQLRDQTLESARNLGMMVKESFDVPPGAYVVRVVVRDSEGRAMAAQNEGVEIP